MSWLRVLEIKEEVFFKEKLRVGVVRR